MKRYHSIVGLGSFVQFRVWVIFIIGDHDVTMKCRTAIKGWFLYFTHVHSHPHPLLLGAVVVVIVW